MPIKSPHEINNGINNIDKNNEVLIELSIFDAISLYLLLTFKVDILGTRTILNEPTIDKGVKSIGKVIPISIPYWLIAWLEV